MRAAALLSLALALAACTQPPAVAPAPTTAPATPSASPVPRPAVAFRDTACLPVRPATFDGRFKELGYVGYLDCAGKVSNEGAIEMGELDVWVDHLDATGAVIGSCRVSVDASLRPGQETSWSATCPVTAAQKDVRVRATDRDATPIPTASQR